MDAAGCEGNGGEELVGNEESRWCSLFCLFGGIFSIGEKAKFD